MKSSLSTLLPGIPTTADPPVLVYVQHVYPNGSITWSDGDEWPVWNSRELELERQDRERDLAAVEANLMGVRVTVIRAHNLCGDPSNTVTRITAQIISLFSIRILGSHTQHSS